MSSWKLRKENFLSFLYPFKCQYKKTLIINYFSEIYANYYKRSNKLFDSYAFQELMQLPMIVSEKLYSTFTSNKNNKIMNIEEFSGSLYTLLFGDMDDKMSMIFDILDFDKDGVILYDDAFLLLSHLHLIENTSDTIEYIEIILHNFFENKTKIDKEYCFNLHKNFDILLLTLISLYKHQTIFSESELSFYESSTQNISKENRKRSSGYSYYLPSCTLRCHTTNDYDELEYQPTNFLFDYLDIVEFKKKRRKIIEDEEEEDDEDFGNDDEDLDALIELSLDFKEIKERFIRECTLETKLFSSTFSYSLFQDDKKKEERDIETDKQVNDILENKSYKNKNKVAFKNKIKKRILLKKEKTEESYSPEKTTQVNSTIIGELENTQNIFQRTTTVKNSNVGISYVKKINAKIQNKQELILYKIKNNKNINKENKDDITTTRKKMVKLVLFGRYIFYFVTFNQMIFLYKKIIPIVNLYINKQKNENSFTISLISRAHGNTFIKFFSYEINDEDSVNKFISKFNNVNLQRDIKTNYYFKYEIGTGKFGHVFLARRNKDNKKFAVKLLQKTNQSFEEYKINRWEIDIFKLLQKIRHPNIIQCIEMFENESQILFVYEYIHSGDLRKYMHDLKYDPTSYNLDNILKISIQMIEGLYIFHKYGIIHRDIKTTNVMILINSPVKKSIVSNHFGVSDIKLTYTDMSDVTVKIIDFGLSRILGKMEKSEDPYGSLCFKAPELIKHEPYNFKVDIWAMGITLYYLIYKILPFEEGSREEIKKAIINEPVQFYVNNLMSNTFYFNNYTSIKDKSKNDLKTSLMFSILKDCLIKDPKQRFSSEQLYNKYYDIIKEL